MIYASRALLTTLLLFCLTASGQVLSKKDIAPIALTFLSGMFDGSAESLKFHYEQVDKKLGLNDNYWNPAISWRNKYHDGNADLGERFPGSTSCFVWTTDGYHLMRMGRNVMAVTAITLKIGDKQKWWCYILEAALFYVTYTLGFNLSYRILIK